MKETIILVAVLFIFFTAVLVYMNISNKKKEKEEEETRKVQFYAEFFGYANIPTVMFTVMFVDHIIEIVLMYFYLLLIVYIANKIHKKHLKNKSTI